MTTYSIIDASVGYAQVATVLAGFAFAGVLLLLQDSAGKSLTDAQANAIISLLIAFFGCTLASFTFTAISGEQTLTTKANTMGFIGAGGFAISTIFIFWAIALLIHEMFVNQQIYFISYLLFVAALIVTPFYFAFSLFDGLVISGKYANGQVAIRENWQFVFLPSYIPIFFFIFSSLTVKYIYKTQIKISYPLFGTISTISIILICIGAGLSMIISSLSKFEISLYISAIWTFIHCTIFGVLLFILPLDKIGSSSEKITASQQ